MIELLIVIGIASFLTAAIVVVSIRFISTARIKATQTTIKKVSELLSSRMNDLERFIDKENKAGELLPDKIPSYARAFGSNRPIALVLGRKDLVRRNFPQLIDKANGIKASGFDFFKHQPETESAEVLYYLLSTAPSFGAETDDLSHFTSSEVADTDGDGLLEFVDSWGRPLRFYRWPTRLIRPAPAGQEADPSLLRPIPVDTNRAARFLIANVTTLSDAQIPSTASIKQDQDDPLGVVNPLVPDPPPPLPQPLQDALKAFETDPRHAHTANTWHVPLILSAGPDGELGLFEPHDTARFGHLAQPDPNNHDALFDNITNLNQRAGGN